MAGQVNHSAIETEATAKTPIHPQNQNLGIPPHEPSWEIKLDALLSSSSGTVNPSVTTTGPSASTVEPNAFVKLHELLSLLAYQILGHKGLKSIGECLNDLAADGLLSNETITRLSSILERTRKYFNIFNRSLRAEDDFKVVMVAQKALCPKVEGIKAKKDQLADLDRQITELQNRRSVVAFELAKDFELSKPYLIEYATGVKRIEQMKMDKRTWRADVTMGEVRWLELKAALEAFLPSSP
ncbi:hypothetical protein ACFX1S_034994 [Malus domestica]